MCGLVGFFGRVDDAVQDGLGRAAAAIRHRGPDDARVWIDREAGIALAHRRLAIVDLSAAGHQPMASACGRYVLAYNGEIYNHLELRRALGEPQWRGTSDTETLLAAIARWGLERTLKGAVGMFALALWDRQQRRLYLARDRIGEKPLYLGWVGGGLAFASELKALRALPGFDATVDLDALGMLLRDGCVPAPHSIYRGIGKLLPGTWLAIGAEDVAQRTLADPTPYWRFADAIERGLAEPARYDSDAAAVDGLAAVLGQALDGQMIADVPLGAFLSGGIDSSTIVALMAERARTPVRTFSIGFHEAGYDEAVHARAVAQALGTRHTELYVDDAAARDVIPRLASIYCEPFADVSQIPTWLVSGLARQHVTVALSGDAGDELFGGYSRYFDAAASWRRVGRLPPAARRAAAALIGIAPERLLACTLGNARRLLPAALADRATLQRVRKAGRLLRCDRLEDFYQNGYASYWQPAEIIAPSRRDELLAGDKPWPTLAAGGAAIDTMMAIDSLGYLPDDILVKVDRAAMAVSLETRVPMLDHRVVEYAWRLPHRYKVRDGRGKWVLRELLARHLSPVLFDRPKQGFGVPLHTWLRGPLREWADALLDPQRIASEGYLNPVPIAARWREHVSGERDWQYYLWPVLMFQTWQAAQSQAVQPLGELAAA
ncbi:MAG: asparagine synthase (glutamine-hydrolyzing) [Lautropia sp.]